MQVSLKLHQMSEHSFRYNVLPFTKINWRYYFRKLIPNISRLFQVKRFFFLKYLNSFIFFINNQAKICQNLYILLNSYLAFDKSDIFVTAKPLLVLTQSMIYFWKKMDANRISRKEKKTLERWFKFETVT